MTRLHSYPNIYNLGHRAAAGILDGPVLVQEKIDGSQFSFGVLDGALLMRSKGADLYPETTDKLFRPAVETAMSLHNLGKLVDGWTYRGETLVKPKHNTLAYNRVPAGNVILFDVDRGLEDYSDSLSVVASALGLECVPTFAVAHIASLDELHALLETVSVLGGSKIEGVVIKAYGRYGPDKKTLMAKYVSEGFKEVHRGDWKDRNPGRGDVIQRLIETYRTPARWQKAIQHLRERGELQEAPQDIGKLMREVPTDVEKEERDEIQRALWEAFWPHISRGITGGLPQWYKDELAKAAFAPTSLADLADPRPVA